MLKRQDSLAIFFLCSLIFFLSEENIFAQADSTKKDSAYFEWIRPDEIGSGLYSFVIIPAFGAVGAISLVSPTYYAEFDKGKIYHGVSFGTGLGIGFEDTTKYYSEIFFSDLRFQGEYAYFFEHPRSRERTTGTIIFDWNALPVLRKNIFRFGMGIGAGATLSQVLPRYHVQAELWIKNAMGLRYLGLFPEHTLFLRGRWNLRNEENLSNISISIGLASTFSFHVP